jgi:hypothetical protein
MTHLLLSAVLAPAFVSPTLGDVQDINVLRKATMEQRVSLLLGAKPSQRLGTDLVPINPGLASREVLGRLGSTISTLNEMYATFLSEETPAAKKLILRGLPNSDMFVYVLDAATASRAGLAFLSGEASKNKSVIIHEYLMYRDFTTESQDPVRVGVGVRMVILLNQNAQKASTLALPALTAAVENRKLEATVRLQVIGLSGKAITEAVPMPSELTFTTLMQMYRGIDTIKSAIWDDDANGDGTLITPQVLSVSRALVEGPAPPRR